MASPMPMTISRQRPVQTTAHRHAPRRPSSLGFADAVMKRYLERQGVRVRSDFIWQRSRFAYSQVNHLRIAPHFSLTVGPYRRQPSLLREVTTNTLAVTHERHSNHNTSVKMLTPRTRESTTRIVERVLTRTIRHDSTKHSRPITDVPHLNTSTPPLLPIERSVRAAVVELPVRHVIREKSFDDSAPSDPLFMGDTRQRSSNRNKISQPTPDASIDLNVLTERVVQAIDRRVLAQRERMGRS